MLNLNTRKNFNLFKDPFTDDVMAAGDVYLNKNSRFAEEYIYITAKIGGMLTIIGESGSGKTTVRRLALDRIQNEGLQIRVVTPRIVDKERLTASHICDAIIADCSAETPRRTLEAKARQVERILTNSSRSGYSHVLMIEEAHDLSIQTIKYLKRFWEMEDGFKKLLGIILIAQPEMKGKLDEARNWEAREVIRRMEVLELEPLADGKEIAAYLDIKFNRLSRQRKEIITDDACAALSRRLLVQARNDMVYSVAYPLLINNWVRKAMNLAASMKVKTVDGQVVDSLFCKGGEQ